MVSSLNLTQIPAQCSNRNMLPYFIDSISVSLLHFTIYVLDVILLLTFYFIFKTIINF